MKIYPEFIKKIDWKLLREQKKTIIEIIYNGDIDVDSEDNLNGILHLIDALQDFAIDEMEMSDKEVFNLTPEEE